MTSASSQEEFTRAAASAVSRLVTAEGPEALDRVAREEFEALNCSLTVGALVHRSPGAGQKVEIVYGDTSHPWIRHYVANDLGRHCPVTGSAGPASRTWTEIRRLPLTTLQRSVFDQLHEFGLENGHIVTVEGFGPTSMAVSTTGREAECDDPLARTMIHLLSVNYGVLATAHWRKWHGGLDAAPAHLTQRQLDCLRWALEGRSSSAIAAILGLSQRTVDEHFAKACAALGVRTRVQACAQAVRLGLISL